MSRLLYGCITWTNKSWRQHSTKQQMCGHQPSITKIKIRRTIHAGHCWRSRDELISDVLLWILHMAEQKQSDPRKPIYSSSVSIRGVALRICQKRSMRGRGGERGSGISVLMAWHDDDDDDDETLVSYLIPNLHIHMKTGALP